MARKKTVKVNGSTLKGRFYSDAIREELGKDEHKKLKALARKLVSKAATGDMAALREVGDRAEGKAIQELGIGGDIVINVQR